MKRVLVMLMLVASTLSMVAVDADAKRLGGGGSFGRQSQGAARPAPCSQRECECGEQHVVDAGVKRRRHAGEQGGAQPWRQCDVQ